MNQEFTDLQSLLVFSKMTQGSSKGFCRLGFATQVVGQVLTVMLNIEGKAVELIIDSDGVRHTLAQHGLAKSKLAAERNQIPIVEADILALSSWLSSADAVKAGQFKLGKQPRIEIELADLTGTTVVRAVSRLGTRCRDALFCVSALRMLFRRRGSARFRSFNDETQNSASLLPPPRPCTPTPKPLYYGMATGPPAAGSRNDGQKKASRLSN